MLEETAVCFGPFRLDLANESVWRGQEACKLTRKAWAVLRYLVEHSGQLVSKEDLFKTVWPEVVVGDAALTVCIRELRQVLGDNSKAPQYIETIYGRGYRFIAPLTSTPPVRSVEFGVRSQDFTPAPSLQPPAPPLVGREAELTQLHNWLAKAATGQRQMVFITGEPGIGKTTVVEAFLMGVRDWGLGAGDQRRQKAKGKNQKPVLSLVEGAKIEGQSTTPNPQHPVPSPWLGRGQCIEQYGVGEGYLPILTALEHLCREPGHERLLSLLRQHAPLWLVQLPSVLSPQEREQLQREVQGATRERMLREMATLLEVLTLEIPLILVLEDLHWSDPSTLDLLTLIARRREPARLLIIGTYRPSELLTKDHPLRTVIQELLGYQQCQELALEGLREAAVAEYLAHRFPVQVFPTRLAYVLQQRTGGNPLFLVNLVDELVRQGVLTDGEGGWMVQGDVEALVQQVPESSRQLITAQMTRVNPATQQTLAAASVAGALFSAAAVAAALETPVTAIEIQCEEVVQQQLFLQRAGIEAWPDGTEAARYGFRHALYQELWHEQGTVTQRQEWYQRIGLRKEVAYNGWAPEIAAELAIHFEQGRDYPRTVQYLQQAAQNALRRSANVEAIGHLSNGLELLKMLPDTPERTKQELMLQIALGTPLMAIKGYGALEVEKVYSRARELCRQMGETPQLFRVLYGLRVFYMVRAEHKTAHELAEQLLNLAERVQDRGLLLQAHYALGNVLFFLGEFVRAQEHLEQGIALYDPQQHNPHASGAPTDPGVGCQGYAGWVLWFLGYPDQALKRAQEALIRAHELSHSLTLAGALHFVAQLHQVRRNVQLTQERAEETIDLSTKLGFVQLSATDMMLRGWALAEQGREEEGMAQIRQGLTASQSMGVKFSQPFFLAQLVEVCGKAGLTEAGLALLAEVLATVDKTGERFYEAELYRLKGQLQLQEANQKSKGKRQKLKMTDPRSPIPDPQSEAEAESCFLKAIEISRQQQAKSLELRAVTSLARLWQSQGKQREAHQMLAEIYNWFTEGFDTKDLQEAKALIEELSH